MESLPSILTADTFPHATAQTNVTPPMVASALSDYLGSFDSLEKCLNNHGVRYPMWLSLVKRYDMLRLYWATIRQIRAQKLSEKSAEMYSKINELKDMPDYLKNKKGDSVSMAGVVFHRDKANSLQRLAEMTERGTVTQDKTININTQVDARQFNVRIDDIMNMPIDDLAKVEWGEG